MSREERQWQREERTELDEALRIAGQHRSDCVCRAVQDWTPGPACVQYDPVRAAFEAECG